MELKNLEALFLEELRDIYSAESQLVKALPKMAKAAASAELKDAFTTHTEETKEQIARLDQIFQEIGKSPRGKKCMGMEGLLAEGDEMAKEKGEPEVKDAGLISAAQRVEHYEIAAYGTARTYAKMLKNKTAEQILKQTLEEEKMTDKKLNKLALQSVNPRAAQA